MIVELMLNSGKVITLPMPSYGKTSPFTQLVALVDGFLAAAPSCAAA